MKPQKAKDLIVSVAMECNIPVEIAKEIILDYWREVRQSLSDLKHSKVHVTNLGDFVVKHWLLEEELKTYNQFLVTMTQRGKPDKRLNDIKSNIVKLENVIKCISEENQRKEFISVHKKRIKKC